MISADNRREFIETKYYDVKRLADGNVYSAPKLHEAREWIYEQDTKYQRRADAKSTIAVIISLLALILSGLGLHFSGAALPSRDASGDRIGLKSEAPPISGIKSPK